MSTGGADRDPPAKGTKGTKTVKPIVGVHASARSHSGLIASLGANAATVDVEASSASGREYAVIVVGLDERDDKTFHDLRQIRLDHPKTPIVALATALDANVAVELTKLGVCDCLLLPAPPDTLWRKIERTVLHSGGPALDSPLLALLWDATAYPAHTEKRRCFRSDTLADYPAYATVVAPSLLPKMLVKNISILTEGCPGGLALIGTNVHVHALGTSAGFRFLLEVPQFPKPISAQGVVKRVLSTPTRFDPTSVMGVEYRLDDGGQEAAVRRYWSESQRRVAAIARSAAGRIE
jgi:hypothetical protein